MKRLKPAARKAEILAAALPLAIKIGYSNITRGEVGIMAGVSGPTLNYHFGTIAAFRRALLRHAVRIECLPVIAQGIVGGEVIKIDEGLKCRALDSLK